MVKQPLIYLLTLCSKTTILCSHNNKSFIYVVVTLMDTAAKIFSRELLNLSLQLRCKELCGKKS